MSRGTQRVQLTVPNAVAGLVERLVPTGMFGTTKAEVYRELLRMKLRELRHDGWFCHDHPRDR